MYIWLRRQWFQKFIIMKKQIVQIKLMLMMCIGMPITCMAQVVQCPCECMNKLDLVSGNGFYLLDSIKYFTRNQDDFQFSETTTSVFEYNSEYKRILTTGYRIDPKYLNRTPIYKLRYTYGENGEKTEYHNDRWDPAGQEWVASQRTLVKYDDNQSIQNQFVYSWNDDIRQWIDQSQTDYTIDSQANHQLTIKKVWNASKKQWENAHRNTRFSENDGLQVTSESFSWKGNEWQPETRSVHIYNGPGFLTEIYYHRWDKETQTWFQMRHMEYIRDEQGRKMEWISIGKDQPDGIEENRGHQIYKYNHDGLLTEVLQVHAQDLQGDFLIRSKQVYYWTLHSTGGLKGMTHGDIKVYPNPFEDYTTIEFPEGIKRIDILDMQGRVVRVYEDVGDRTLRIYQENLMPAMYFVKLYGEHTFITRIVIR